MRVPAIPIAPLIVVAAALTQLDAQSPLPRTYSFAELNNLMAPNMTVKVYRDGARELLDESRPASADTPGGYHMRILYEFDMHRAYTWDLIETSRPCGIQTITETAAPFLFDVISGTPEFTRDLAKSRPKTVGTETLHGIPATVQEVADPAGNGTSRTWRAVTGGYVLKVAQYPKSGPPQVQLEVRDLVFTPPPPGLLMLPASCAAGAPPAPPPQPSPAPPPRGSPTPASAGQAGALPPGFTPPPGFTVDNGNSKSYAFSHVEISYQKAGVNQRIDPEGRTWVPFFRLVTPNRTGDQTDAAMRTNLKQQGWEILTPNGLLIAHKVEGGKEQWFSGAAFAGDYRATIVEVGPPPHSILLPAPAATVENVADNADFPYLMSFPGSKLVRTVEEPGRTFNAAAPGQPEMLVGQPEVRKFYQLPPSVSNYEFVAVYRDALTKAGWTVIRTAVGSDAQVIAHWAKNGRDIFVYLAGDVFSVADVGAQNEAKKLAADLARTGHVAIYGIYFDVDKATLKPESEVALQHMLELLKTNASLSVEVQGHTDNSGTPAHNLPLSDQRAAAVKAWLVGHGIAAARLTTKGYGETQPVADNRTPEGRAKNRRVELKKN